MYFEVKKKKFERAKKKTWQPSEFKEEEGEEEMVVEWSKAKDCISEVCVERERERENGCKMQPGDARKGNKRG